MATKGDIQLASVAAGFTLGFGFLTVWEAIKQTKANHNPLRSVYIYMLWGEILANLAIGIVGWLFLDGHFGPTVPVLFSILFLWVFEIQLLMQIIINRIALIAEHRSTVKKLKWGTAVLITCVNIAVFCIWIPAHTIPPVSPLYVEINKYWDRMSKIIILIVDAGLNWYFLRTVKIRLVKYHGLTKYKPLITFNFRLMVVSIAMDVMLIGLMSLPNQVVYIQFHPVAYMVKLNIEMSMASLIVRLARGNTDADIHGHVADSSTDPRSHNRSQAFNGGNTYAMKSHIATTNREQQLADKKFEGIHRRTDVEVHVEEAELTPSVDGEISGRAESSRTSPSLKGKDLDGDELPLNYR